MSPEDLKASILKWAMTGKLTKQKPDDEPVEILLERIKIEKQKLYKEDKLKKQVVENYLIYENENSVYYENKSNSLKSEIINVPYVIPKYWKYRRFKDIVNFYIGKTPPRSNPEWWGNEIPWVSIADMTPNGVINKTKESLSDKSQKLFNNKISPKETLIMSFKLTVGRVSILGINATHNEAIISIFPYSDKNYVFRNFLFNILPTISNEGKFKNAIKGMTLNSSSISNLLIPIPSIDEQNRINKKIQILEEKLAKYSEYYYRLQELNISLTKKLSVSVLKKLIQNDGFKKRKIYKEKLIDIAGITIGKYISSKEIIDDGEFVVMGGGFKSTGRYNKFNFEKGIVIPNRGSYSGYVNYLTEKFWATSNAFVINPINNILLDKFLYYYLKSLEYKIRNSKFGGAIPMLTRKQIENVIVEIPSLEQQNKILEKLDEVFKKNKNLELLVK
ncbi:hypothetical protein CJJ23_02350 [Mycoplasmopsis agassizii]|uniref:Type I restriction modification DNA specificity domain-containing protein n=1 Tax=Mycoplasmopsis agassizii TaxID=33922 RepID=A0A269TIR0_9BACT|nr:restriction endonuclease subunit S [Mycoplasmopsis agassizii]PAK21359.1 hypothetical protein CJJ23_02350 [Mycoplasmopsis agassizii]